MRFERAPFDLAGTVRAAIEGAGGIADARAVGIELAIGQQPLIVDGDHHRLLQVLANLLSNAIRASSAGGTVRVAIERREGRILVTVDDEGDGVALDLAPRIFERFAQASDAMPGGSGLGLAISREIILAHEGRIWFGEAPGGGARFAFSLPAAPEQPPLRGSRSCILVGEADPEIAQWLRAMLEAEDCAVECVATGREVQEAARSGRYDVLVLDSELPDGGGIETLRILRQRTDTRKLPAIIIGGAPLPDVALDLTERIAKPVDPAWLSAALRRALERSAAIRPTLLHIDGDPDMLEVVAVVLAEQGRIIHATSVASARAVLATRSVDIVILDPSLPDGSGSALFPDLLQPDGSTIPTVIYSAIEVPPELEKQVDAVLIKSRRSLASLACAILGILATVDDETDSV
jgi:DNA-binding response OmpR family regulator